MSENGVLHDEVIRVSATMNSMVEQRIRIYVQPKPRWMPQRIWARLLRRMLVLEQTVPKVVRR